MMKHRKWLGLELAACTFLTPLGVAQAGGEPAEVSEDFEPTEGAPLGTIAVDPSLRSFGLYKKVNQYESMKDGKIMFRQTWPELRLADGDGRSMLGSKNFPKLAAALKAYNDSAYQEAIREQSSGREEALRDWQERKKSGYADSFNGHSNERDLIVKRADSLILSFVETQWTYTGGAHGGQMYRGVNFDASTGERLSLYQVFPDGEMLVETIIAKLYEENKQGTFFDSMEATVADQIIHDKASWVIGPRGVTFYFNQYEIAAYAAGTITTTIMFDAQPGLFNEKYKLGPASYCEELTTYPSDTVSLYDDGAGKADSIMAFVDSDKLNIILDGKKVYSGPFVGGNKITPVFVHTGGGSNFLYVDYGYASPQMGVGRQMDVFRLDSGKATFVHTSPYSFQRTFDQTKTGEQWIGQWIMTDPYEFNIDEPYLSTTGESKTHTVQIGEEGFPTFG